MEMPKDYETRMADVAKGTPRNVVAMLLKKLMPPEPVKVRRPEGGWKSGADFHAIAAESQALATTEKLTGKVKTRKPRRAIKSCRYKVLDDFAAANHRYGTWTRSMVESAIGCVDDEDIGTSLRAQTYLATHYPQYADRKIDWNWLAKDVSYIELI